MLASPQAHQSDAILSRDVLDHLEVQLAAARQLFQVVLEQGAAIRRHDVPNVVRLAGILQAEAQRRKLLDEQRAWLLERAGARLGISAASVSITLLESVLEPDAATRARARSSELLGLLDELKREHTINRVLMTQELAFLDHLLRLADDDSGVGYDAGGDHRVATTSLVNGRRRVLDMEA
jgi:hypothetical protein